MSEQRFSWWNNLLHGGLLLDAQRLRNLAPADPPPLDGFQEDRLRRRLTSFQDDPDEKRAQFVTHVLESVCGLARPLGEWSRGSEVSTAWSRRAITGESVRPRHLWISPQGAVVPVFIDDEKRLGIGRGKRIVSHALGWLRQGDEQLAVVTNGQQWRLLFAGLDYEAFCQWDVAQWFTEGEESEEFRGMRALLAPGLWTPAASGQPCPLLAAINESRKGAVGPVAGPGRAGPPGGGTAGSCPRAGAQRAAGRHRPTRHLPRGRPRDHADGGGAVCRVARGALAARQPNLPHRLQPQRASRPVGADRPAASSRRTGGLAADPVAVSPDPRRVQPRGAAGAALRRRVVCPRRSIERRRPQPGAGHFGERLLRAGGGQRRRGPRDP